MLLSLVACNAAKDQHQVQTKEKVIKVTDFLGREVSIEKVPQRIVSLSPSTTELLYVLGVGNRLVGVTDYDDYPSEVKKLPKVGGFQGPNMEAIAEQQPDIIFAASISGREQMEALQNLGIPVVVLEAKQIDQIYQSIELIGELTGTEEKGKQIVKDMKAKINDINNRVKDLPTAKVFYLVDINGNWSAGRGTFIDELIDIAGGNNIVDDVEGWVQYSPEKLLQKNPDVIITAPHACDVDELKALPAYQELNAVKNDRIKVISDDNLISRASNRIVLGLEQIAKNLHPEAFE
jgi:iron complex transport system substrate-binding protein